MKKTLSVLLAVLLVFSFALSGCKTADQQQEVQTKMTAAVEKVEDEIRVEGNACPRGYTYAVNELTNPLRTLTTTVEIESQTQKRLPVISSAPLPKGRIM